MKTERCGVYLVVAVSAQLSAFSQGERTLGWNGSERRDSNLPGLDPGREKVNLLRKMGIRPSAVGFSGGFKGFKLRADS